MDITSQRTAMRPADMRRAVSEWVSKGCTVKIGPDGSIEVKPPQVTMDDADLVDWTRKA
ncbi:hypothetical protein PSM7751_01995 [Pseudooceanicola marinus]|uniref:Uncharacterized protein n=1 Tax=Pseudooceanicola marinus TaxID=396013 RepID=A0A1X6Z8V3_9RHOB|nr:long-chain fatty acid--CoA ligase [Pseudooceanicola marinus]SLN43908.1 hypothetical protein PSM7751_01995 [Pseudooceanicola marinus]